MVTRVDMDGKVWGFKTIDATRRYYPLEVLGKVTGVPAFEVSHGTILAGWHKGTRPYDPTGEIVSIHPIQRRIYNGELEHPSHFDSSRGWVVDLVDTHVHTITAGPKLEAAPMSNHEAIFHVMLKPTSTDPLCTGMDHPATLENLTHDVHEPYYNQCATAAKSYCQHNDDPVYCACMQNGARCDQENTCYDADPKNTFLIEHQYADAGLNCGTVWAVSPIAAGATEALSGRHTVTKRFELSNGIVMGIVVCVLLFLLIIGVVLTGRGASP
jgi:hypothetical protein